MRLFLYEVVARIVAIYLCYDCGRRIWYGLVERKITLINTDLLDWWTPSQVRGSRGGRLQTWSAARMERPAHGCR